MDKYDREVERLLALTDDQISDSWADPHGFNHTMGKSILFTSCGPHRQSSAEKPGDVWGCPTQCVHNPDRYMGRAVHDALLHLNLPNPTVYNDFFIPRDSLPRFAEARRIVDKLIPAITEPPNE